MLALLVVLIPVCMYIDCREAVSHSFPFLTVSYLSVEALFSCVLLLQLLMPVIANNTNHHKWPGVVSRDVMSHVGGLKGEVFTFSGQVKGKTLLPLPPQADAIVKASEQQARLGGMEVT